MWHATSHARPTYCNICREQLSGNFTKMLLNIYRSTLFTTVIIIKKYLGVTSHGYSCEVCKCKIHKRCVDKAISNCKWTTLASVGKDIIEDKQGVIMNSITIVDK